jgi:hypothetical protein
MISPASGPNAVKPRIRSPSFSTSDFMKPRVSEIVCVLSTCAIGNFVNLYSMPRSPCLPLVETDSGQFGVGEQAERHLPAGRRPVPPRKVVENDAEVVKRDVCKVRATSAVTDRPDPLRSRPSPVVYLDMTVPINLDPGSCQPEPVCVGDAASGGEQVRSLNHAGRCVQANRFAGSSSDLLHRDPGPYLDPLITEEFRDCRRDVGVLVMNQRCVPLDHCHSAAEATDRLREFKAHVAPPRTTRRSGTRSSSRASTWVRGRASRSPGMSSIRA